MEAPRERFRKNCETYGSKKDVISFDDVVRAFNGAYLLPAPTIVEYRRLFKALEVYYDEEKGSISWLKILSATYDRGVVSHHGIFPKNPMKNSSKAKDEETRWKEEAARNEQQK